MNYANFFELKGKTITSIQGSNSDDSDTIITTSDGSSYTLTHIQDCCEHVRVYGTVGNIDDVLNEEVIAAEDTNPMDNPNAPDYRFMILLLGLNSELLPTRVLLKFGGWVNQMDITVKLFP